MTIILFIIVLLVTVLVHEWGHFITAKRAGMRVEEFGFGIPPRLWSWKRGETTYSINAIPFGGFVKISGENGIDASAPLERQFESKPWYSQSIVLIAGVVCNILLALLLFTIAFSFGTSTLSPTGTPTVIHVSKGSPTEKSGIQVGDTIVSIKKEGLSLSSIETAELRKFIANSTAPLSVSYIHGSKTLETTISPIEKDSVVAIGVGVEKVAIERVSLIKAFGQAVNKTLSSASLIFKTVGTLLGKLITGQKQTESLIGPIGLATEIRNASHIGFGYLLSFTALISVNLAVINILPFPALDGGRLLIVLLERITRKKFSKTAVGWIHAGGFILLIGLMIILSVGDIRRLF